MPLMKHKLGLVDGHVTRYTSCVCKDTDEGGGEDGEDRADGNGALRVLQISRAVRSRHDS